MPQRRAAHKARKRARTLAGTLPDDLYDYIEGEEGKRPAPKSPLARRAMTENWTVSDDWPERVPVTDAEIRLFEAWFGDILDDLFGKPF